jgi:peptidoglycan/xylan/chitin deacetylase (PgdA/CDA1 family)
MGHTGRIIALNYHRLSDEAHHESVDQRFNVRAFVFVQQMHLIREMHIPVVSLDDLISGKFAAKFGVTLTFDDGNLSDFDMAHPALKELNFTAAFFPVVNSIGKGGFVTWRQLSEIANDSFTVGSHGLSHSLLTKLPRTEQRHELGCSKAIIEQGIAKGVTHFASPYGWYNNALVLLAKEAGYKALMTTTLKVNVPDRKPFLVHRWNIRRNTSFARFKRMLERNGYISPLTTCAIAFKQYVKAILGRPSGLPSRLLAGK